MNKLPRFNTTKKSIIHFKINHEITVTQKSDNSIYFANF